MSLTFDGSTADQREAVQILDRHELTGTFFTNSGNVDTPGYLTRDDLRQIEQGGHEIGGHTVLHTDLTRLDPAEARREVCIDRKTLQGWGLHPGRSPTPTAHGRNRHSPRWCATAATAARATSAT